MGKVGREDPLLVRHWMPGLLREIRAVLPQRVRGRVQQQDRGADHGLRRSRARETRTDHGTRRPRESDTIFRHLLVSILPTVTRILYKGQSFFNY